MIKNKSTVDMFEWAPNHFSWPLVDRNDLSIKLEEIPVGGKSEFHFHKRAFQFFFILEGEAAIKVEDSSFELKRNDGIEIPLSRRHQIENVGRNKLLFILISSPKVQDNDIFTLREKTVM